MSGDRIYLDHNATSPLRPEARDAAVQAMDMLGNPSSVHGEGRAARRIVEDARERVAALVNTAPANVVFTSGATEANNWVLSAGWQWVFVPAIEHDSVLAPVRRSNARLIETSSDHSGIANIDEIGPAITAIGPSAGSALVALQMANNETGVLQPLSEAIEICRSHDLPIHTDAVQAVGRVAMDFDELGVDTLSLSSHKIGGPMGVGALVLRDGIDVRPLIVGGGQERRRRSGTENVAGIAGFGAAAVCAAGEIASIGRLGELRDQIEARISAMTPDALVVGAAAERLSNTTCLVMPGTSAETLLIKLDLAGVAVSSGSACSSGKVGASHVLSAMGIAPDMARGAIRISLGWNTTVADVDAFLEIWSSVMGAGQRAVA